MKFMANEYPLTVQSIWSRKVQQVWSRRYITIESSWFDVKDIGYTTKIKTFD